MMKRARLFRIFLPNLLFLVLLYVLPIILKATGLVGPIESESGFSQPYIGAELNQPFFYGLIGFTFLGLVYSLYQLWFVKHWIKFVLLPIVVLAAPLQCVLSLAATMAVFGK